MSMENWLQEHGFHTEIWGESISSLTVNLLGTIANNTTIWNERENSQNVPCNNAVETKWARRTGCKTMNIITTNERYSLWYFNVTINPETIIYMFFFTFRSMAGPPRTTLLMGPTPTTGKILLKVPLPHCTYSARGLPQGRERMHSIGTQDHTNIRRNIKHKTGWSNRTTQNGGTTHPNHNEDVLVLASVDGAILHPSLNTRNDNNTQQTPGKVLKQTFEVFSGRKNDCHS